MDENQHNTAQVLRKKKSGKLAFIFFVLFALIFLNKQGFSQSSISDSSIFMPLIKIGYSGSFPSKDLKKQFGFTNMLNTRLEIKLESNFLFGVKYNFLWGNNYRDSGMLKELQTNGGGIINSEGEFGIFEMLQRGHHLGVYVGKLFPYFSPNPNSGIVATFGVGLLVHKLNFNNISGDLIQLNGEFAKGYDRYTSGLSFSEFIGYRFHSNNRLLNFYGGVEFTQAYTKIRRDYQVDYEIDDPRFGPRKDFLFSVQVGWILPLYKRAPKEFYY